MSTLFAFRAAAFGELPMITNVSFASPYCGDQGFRDHFYELEKSKRIRHLRVSNDEDAVTLFPPVTFPIPNEFYKHTGMNIRLYNEDQFLMPKCRLFYPKKDSLPNEVRNAVLSNFVAGLSVGVLSKHLCPEYSKRLDDAEEELQKITLEGLYSDPDITGWSYKDTPLDLKIVVEEAKRFAAKAKVKAEESQKACEEARIKAEIAEEARLKSEEEAKFAVDAIIMAEAEAKKATEAKITANEARVKAEFNAKSALEASKLEKEERIKAEAEAEAAESAMIKAVTEAKAA